MAIHQRAITRLHKHIFKTHSEESFGVTRTTILAPSVWEILQFSHEGSTKVREVALGGFDFELSPNQHGFPIQLHVSHRKGKQFDVWLTNADHIGTQYTACARTVEFAQLPTELWRMVQDIKGTPAE